MNTISRRFHDDPDFDSVEVGPLRLTIQPRFKRSSVSGDQWRWSCRWQLRTDDGEWEPYGDPMGCVDAAVARLYPLVMDGYHAHPGAHAGPVRLYRKGLLIAERTLGPTLSTTAARLPWFLIEAGDDGVPDQHIEALSTRCDQIGCGNEAQIRYRLLRRYSPGGELLADDPESRIIYVRQFCLAHSERGDADMEDSADNYELMGD